MKASFSKVGGIAAITEGVLYIIGFVVLFAFLPGMADDTLKGTEQLSYILEHKTLFKTWMILIYIVFGIFLVPLAIVLQDEEAQQTSVFAKAAPVFGFIWSGLVIASGAIAVVGLDTVERTFATDPTAALTSWRTIVAIQEALGGGVEIVGGMWMLLISTINLSQQRFSKALAILGIAIGTIGILTVVPGLGELMYLFGIAQIVWFFWIGFALLRNEVI